MSFSRQDAYLVDVFGQTVFRQTTKYRFFCANCKEHKIENRVMFFSKRFFDCNPRFGSALRQTFQVECVQDCENNELLKQNP